MKKMHHLFSKKPLATATAIAIYGTSALYSQQLLAQQEVTQLDKVVVTATRSEQSLSSISGSVQIIDAEELLRQSQPGQKLTDVLEKLVPGMGPSTQTVTDRTQTLRGRKILVLIDGIAQTENRQISRQMNSIRPENIERIEVVSGASAIYGGGATGGIINIITKKPDGQQLSFTSSIGTKFSSGKLSATTLSQTVHGNNAEGLDFYFSGTFEDRGAIYDANGDRVNPDPSQVSRMDSQTKDILFKLGYQLNDDQQLQLSGQYFRDKMDTDYAPNYGDDLANLTENNLEVQPPVKGLQLDSQPYTHRNNITLQFSDKNIFGGSLEAQLFYREREARFYPYAYDLRAALDGILQTPGANLMIDDDVLVNQSTSESEVYGIKLVLNNQLNDRLQFTYGFDFDVDKGKQSARSFDDEAFVNSNGLVLQPVGDSYQYGPDVDTTQLGIFLQSSIQIADPLTFNFGIRHERAELDIGNYTPIAETWYLPIYTQPIFAPVFGNFGIAQPTLSFTELEGDKLKYDATLFNAGVVFELTDQQEVFINYSEGFEVPDAARILRNSFATNSQLATLFALNPALVAGATPTNVDQANLDAIKTKSIELGWRANLDHLEASITGFYNQSDKTIDFTQNFAVDLLDQKRKIYGAELAATAWVGDFELGGSFAFTEGRTEDETHGWLDLQAADVSPEKLVLFIGQHSDSLYWRLQGTHFNSYDKGRVVRSGNVQQRQIDGYTTFDLIASYELPVGTLSGGITNLLDKEYQTVYSQWANDTYDSLSASNAEGRAVSIGYTVTY